MNGINNMGNMSGVGNMGNINSNDNVMQKGRMNTQLFKHMNAAGGTGTGNTSHSHNIIPPSPMGRPSSQQQQQKLPPEIRELATSKNLMKAKDALPLINSLSWEERVIYLSRHVMGGSKGNGFFRAMSKLKTMRRKMLSEGEPRLKKRRTSNNNDTVENFDSVPSDDHRSNGMDHAKEVGADKELEKLKRSPKVAKAMLIEMGLGITFCDTVTSTIESILSEIDPKDKNYKGRNEEKTDVDVGMGADKHASKVKPQAGNVRSAKRVSSQDSTREQNAGVRGFFNLASNPNQRNPKSKTKVVDNLPDMDPSLTRMMPSNDDAPNVNANANTNTNPHAPGRKMTKKELAYWRYELNRFKTLKGGGFVVLKPSNQETRVLARVVKDWIGPNLTLPQLMSLSQANRDSIAASQVALQHAEGFNMVDSFKLKSVRRSSVLPLPCNHEEEYESLMRCNKGTRVYAMYPSTMSLYPATVVDNITFSKGNEKMCVVQFDGDEDKSTGTVPQRKVPARFLTMIPLPMYPSNSRGKSKGRRNSNNAVTSKGGISNPTVVRMGTSQATMPQVRRKKSNSSRSTSQQTPDKAMVDLLGEMPLSMDSMGDLDDLGDFDFAVDETNL